MDDLKFMTEVETILQRSLSDLLPYVTYAADDDGNECAPETLAKEKSRPSQYDMIYPIAKENCQLKILLLEIEEAIKKENQKIELQSIYQSLSRCRLKALPGSRSTKDENTLDCFSKEILAYDSDWKKKNESANENNSWSEERHFFNINITYDDAPNSSSVKKLIFTTRYKSMCVRINLESFKRLESSSPAIESKYDYKMISDFSLTNFDSLGVTYLHNQMSAKCFIEEYVWPQIAKLDNYCMKHD